MKRIFTTIQKSARNILLLTVLAGTMASCDSILDFEEGDCSIEYQVKFKYDYNMEYVDAFAKEVKTVTLYAFDENGKLINQKTEEGERLAAGEYAMTIDLTPGEYDMITWAGVDDQSFAVPLLTPGVSKLEDLTVLTRRNMESRTESEEGKYIVPHSSALPSLFHGRVEHVVLSAKPHTRSIPQVVTTVSLTKNTNVIRVAIAQVNQDPTKPVTRAINKDRFSYAIYDDNGYMDYNNNLLEDNMLTYLPFATENSSISTRAFSTNNTSENEYPAAIAEISIVRLLQTQNPKLEIIDQETGKELLPSDQLIQYLALLMEQGFIDMPLQEYLDRENLFNITFFVDEDLTMIKTVIQINDWIVQINDFEL